MERFIHAEGDYFEGGGCGLILTFDQMASAVPEIMDSS